MPITMPIPPIDALPAWQAGLAGAVCALAGGIVLLWGRLLHRVLLMIAGAGLAYWLSPALADRTGLSPLAVKAAAILAAVILCLVLARLIWAYLAAAAAAAAAALIILPACMGETPGHPWPAFAEGAGCLPDWLAEAGRFLLAVLQTQWQTSHLWLLAAAGAAAVVPLLLFLLRPRLAAIFMTSLAGGSAVVGGLALLAGLVRPSAIHAAWQNGHILAGMVGVLLLGGMVFQYYGAFQADKAEKAKEAQADKKSDKPSDEKGQSKKPEKADKDSK